MKQRILTSLFIVLATTLAVVSKLIPLSIGDYIFDVFILFVLIVAGFEMCNLMEGMHKSVNKLLTSFYGIYYYIILQICLAVGVKFAEILIFEFVALLVYFLIVFAVEFIKNREKSAKENSKVAFNSIIACLYPTFWFGLILNINHIDIYAGKYFSLVFILVIIATAMLTDTFAYLVGSKLRGPKLAPKISPNKTISGAVGGLLGGILGAMLVFLIAKNIPALSSIFMMHSLTWWKFLLVGLFCSLVGQVGDLFESKLKRNANIKDSGSIFPGHGGMLDRIDAMIFVTTFVYMCVSMFII